MKQTRCLPHTAEDIINEMKTPIEKDPTYPADSMFSMGYLSNAIIMGIATYFNTSPEEALKVYDWFSTQVRTELLDAEMRKFGG